MVQRCPGSIMLEAALPPGSRVPWLPHELRLGPRGAPRRGWMPIEEGPRRCTLCVACRSTRTFAHTRSHMQAEPAAAEPTTAEPLALRREVRGSVGAALVGVTRGITVDSIPWASRRSALCHTWYCASTRFHVQTLHSMKGALASGPGHETSPITSSTDRREKNPTAPNIRAVTPPNGRSCCAVGPDCPSRYQAKGE